MIIIDNGFTSPDLLPTPISTTPMSEDWREGIKSKWWSTLFDGQPANDREAQLITANKTLIAKILTFAGQEVCMPLIEEDRIALTNRGQFLYGDNSVLKKGRPSQCHANSAELWESDRRALFLMTGYALSDDGMWRQHSWCVEREGGRDLPTLALYCPTKKQTTFASTTCKPSP